MNSPITDFIRSLTPQENPPQSAPFEAVWQTLGSLLKREMQRLGYWQRPPACLGLPWAEDWATDGAFDELLADCFTFTLLLPLGVWVEISQARSHVDALVVDRMRWFLTDTERLFDPLGYGLRKELHTLAREMVHQGSLHVVAGDSRVGLQTTLGFTTLAERELPDREALHTATQNWPRDLIPNLITARGTHRRKLIQTLPAQILDLYECGIESFQLAELIDTLRLTVEETWHPKHSPSEGPHTPTLPHLKIPKSFEERQDFRSFLGCVGDSIDHLTTEETTHGPLASLWIFLRYPTRHTRENAPSLEALENYLPIAAEQVHPASLTLRRLVDFCRGSTYQEGPEDPSLDNPSLDNPSLDTVQEPPLGLMEQVRIETKKAQTRTFAGEHVTLRPSLNDLCPGRFFVARDTSAPAVFWLVVVADLVTARLKVVPADLFPLVGSRDFLLENSDLGPVKLRCGFEMEIPSNLEDFAHAFAPFNSKALAANEMEQVLRHRRGLAGGQQHRPPITDDIDSDPAMVDWVETVLTPACHHLEALVNPFTQHPRSLEQSFKETAAPRIPSFDLTERSTVTGLLVVALLLALALAISLHCGQEVSGRPQPPAAPLSTHDCVTLIRIPQWCGEPEEVMYARTDLYPNLINLPQGGRPVARTRDRGRLP